MCLFCLQTCLHSDPDLLTLIRKRLSQVMVLNFFVSYHFLHGHKPCGYSNSTCNCVTDPHMSCTLKSAIRKSLYLFYFNSSKRNSLDITNSKALRYKSRFPNTYYQTKWMWSLFIFVITQFSSSPLKDTKLHLVHKMRFRDIKHVACVCLHS